jgi:alpha-ribazole phosphatase
MEVILVRHTSVDVPTGTCYGQTNVPLRSTFEEEAMIVASALQGYAPFDRVYTSPLSRCTRLATFCGYADAQRDKRLLEMNFGEWEMQRYEEIEDPRLQAWYADWKQVSATGGESFVQQYERVAQFLSELKEKPYSKVAIFSHGGVLTCAKMYAEELSAEEAFASPTPYGGIINLTI